MSQPLLDVPQTDTVGVKKAGTAMAEIVETDFFQSVVFQYKTTDICINSKKQHSADNLVVYK